jgi:ATP-binding cassette, subfamily C (CFTR/MRP), member 1
MDDGWLQCKRYVSFQGPIVSVSPNLANALGIFTPPIALIVFAIVSRNRGDQKLDAGTAFTTIALMAFITHPANMLMAIWPRAVACMANFERSQRYLLESQRQDNRLEPKKTVLEVPTSDSEDDTACCALVADKLSVKYSSNLQPILQDINFNVKTGCFWIFSGNVGSGKTTLAQVILGEISPSSGSMAVSTRCVGFCTQTPWLPGSSIKEIICEASDSDLEWYKTVIYACGLEKDMNAFPDGDQTQIGSRGIKLSGGQRHRVVS